MKLFIKSPLVFIVTLTKWGLVFFSVALLRILALKEYSGFFDLFYSGVVAVCVLFPAIYSLSFMDTLVFLMRKRNTSFLPLLTIIFPLVLLILFLQPLLYSYLHAVSLQSSTFISTTTSTSASQFLQLPFILNLFIKQVFFMLDDFRQAYFTGYLRYLFLSFSYVFFLFSFSIFTIKAHWQLFNLLSFLLVFNLFVFLYNVMNAPGSELYVFWFSSNALKGLPSQIITVGASSLIYFYGIASRFKKKRR